MCPTVSIGKAHPSLLGHHSSDRTTMAGRLPIATKSYRSLVQRCIVEVQLCGEGLAMEEILPSHERLRLGHGRGCGWLG
jgi:hypothetical protein